MKTRAAALRGVGQDWEILEFDLADPGPGEVRIKLKVAGLCHSDEHLQHLELPLMVGGHEGAGIIEAVGEGVTGLEVGDHVACSWIPSCGVCRFCVTGQGNLCDLGANMMSGELANGGYRFHYEGQPVGAIAATGTFAEHAVLDQRSVIKVDKDLPLEWVSLVTCGVATGWGSVINAGQVRAGDVVAIYGCGGIGANAVNAAVQTNAGLVAVIDPVEGKRDFAKKLGADFVYASGEEAMADLWERTNGVGVDVAVVTAGVVTGDIIRDAFFLTRKGGTIVLTGVADDAAEENMHLSSSLLTLFGKRIIGTLYGDCNPRVDVPRLLELARAGKMDLDGMITRKYTLDEINTGFKDMLEGRNIRGLIVYDD
ncbi:NDMA-dependent alcohol dehydrogenase [Pseudarthrobacter sulfonivorans]|uniref:Zn-dependent alcohol dehydrogenase n=1 Tax=Pseudarthrobacter sulfonivorans TaxID=121292 RepID=UPI00168B6228|nr:Zn-dependent alcohol dehydrogenase [Pseudarthrobacter sulfonivorans]